jgi:cyclophilin family peptidyl-prolyl cis-trans isomerase
MRHYGPSLLTRRHNHTHNIIHTLHVIQGGNIATPASGGESARDGSIRESFELNYDGNTGESIFGKVFDDESFAVQHARRGMVSMVNSGPNTNGSQFFITFDKAAWLDNKHVVFGEVVSGIEVLDAIEELGDEGGNVTALIQISDCGEVFRAFNGNIYTDTQLKLKVAWGFAQFESEDYPGCVDKSELSFVMGKIGFPFSLEDHANAAHALDEEGTGKIPLKAFMDWWLQYAFRTFHDDQAEIVDRFGAFTRNPFSVKSQLQRLKAERRNTEVQVKQLRNRIGLLQKTELKVWNDIKQKKKQLLSTLKQQKDEEVRLKELSNFNKEKSMLQLEAMESQDRRYVQIEMRRMARLRAAQDVLKSKQEAALHTKQEKKQNAQYVAVQREKAIVQAQRNRNVIQAAHAESNRRREMEERQRRLLQTSEVVSHIVEEENIVKVHARERRELEREEEMALLRLKVAEKESMRTWQQLESAQSLLSPKSAFRVLTPLKKSREASR